VTSSILKGELNCFNNQCHDIITSFRGTRVLDTYHAKSHVISFEKSVVKKEPAGNIH